MLENAWFNIEYGINHVLDINAYDHVLFLIVLTVPYMFKDWKRVLLLVSMFTIGHTLSLVLAAYKIVTVNGVVVEFLIPVSILIVALFNVFTAGKGAQREKVGVLLLEFALGIELAQIIIVFVVLFLGYVVQTIFRFTKRDWIMVISAVVVGLVIPMILNSEFIA